ncbi:MAG: xylulokinase [Acidobacteriota bacterium]
MTEYFIGIDSGTQSTKTLVLDSSNGEIVASATATYDLIEGLPPGHKEQNPSSWTDAVRETIPRVLNESGIDRGSVCGIGVSGQQHGFVALDAEDLVIRPAKLWCDTSTEAECAEIIASLGGLESTIETVGNGMPAGFTAPKILWLKKHEPESYARLRSVLLPHDYINFFLTGRKWMEDGDASGTGLFDVRRRTWSQRAIDAIDPNLAAMLPHRIGDDQISGHLRDELRAEWGLGAKVIVSAGGGDNMMGAIGTGNVKQGVVSVSLGTSGTVYACSESPVVDPQGEIAAFCDSTGRWLPLVCTMNVTAATEMVRQRFGLSYTALSEAALSSPPGNDGLLLIPFFEGERTPDRPDGTGVYFGVREKTFDIPHFARAAMEGTALGLNYGLNRMRDLGIEIHEIRATGGGSKSEAWRQILADVFNAEVVCLKNEEGAALGAALQAMWAYRNAMGDAIGIEELCERFAGLEESTRVLPRPAEAGVYQRLQTLHNQLANDLRGAFALHRGFITT